MARRPPRSAERARGDASAGRVPGDRWEAGLAGLARRLLVGDRDHLMLRLRRLTLGDVVAAVLTCPSCRARMDLTIDLAEAPVEGPPQMQEWQRLELPDRKQAVRFRLPTGADQEAVVHLDEGEAVAALLRRCLRDESEALSARGGGPAH